MTRDFNVKFSSTIGKLKEGEWMKWSREVGMSLRAQHAWGYIDGTQVVPKEGTAEKLEYLAEHDQIVGALGTIVEASLQNELLTITDAKGAWMKLKEKTHSKGIIAKLEAITSAIRNCFNSSTPASTTIVEIKDSLATVFEVKEPTQEEWLIVLLLNALSDGKYDWLRKDLLGFMTNSKVQMTSSDIVERIETEHRDKTRIPGGESAMTAKSKQSPRSKSKLACTVCKRQGHSAEKCWDKGGGSEGDAPEWWKKAREQGRTEEEKVRPGLYVEG
jgi:hypothetical protein